MVKKLQINDRKKAEKVHKYVEINNTSEQPMDQGRNQKRTQKRS